MLGDVSASYSLRDVLALRTYSDGALSDGAESQQSSSCGGGSASLSSDECNPYVRSENCSYECSLLHDPPDGYNGSCEFVEENCGGEYELLNYLQFMDCHLGPSLRVRAMT